MSNGSSAPFPGRGGAPFSLILFALLAAPGCGGASQLTPMPSVPPGVTVEHQDRHYEIRGGDVETLRNQMRDLGPGSFFGRVDWRIRTRYRYGTIEATSLYPGASRETECEMKAVEVRLTLTVTMPRWLAPEDADPELVRQWAEFEAALRIHEEGHRDIALHAATDVLRRHQRLRTPDCAFIQREARDLLDERLEHWNALSREYDVTTGHGRTQGAVWPPRTGE